MFYLWMEQRGEGCDYTIGCGQKLLKLKGDSIEAAREDAKRQFDYHGVYDERSLKSAVILSFAEDALELARDFEKAKEQVRADYELARKREQLEKLKRELGE
jgi:hypothetical protein